MISETTCGPAGGLIGFTDPTSKLDTWAAKTDPCAAAKAQTAIRSAIMRTILADSDRGFFPSVMASRCSSRSAQPRTRDRLPGDSGKSLSRRSARARIELHVAGAPEDPADPSLDTRLQVHRPSI